MRAASVLYFLEVAQLVGDVCDVLLVFPVDGPDVLEAALLLVADYVVLCLQLLLLVCYLQLQGRILGEPLEQLSQLARLAILVAQLETDLPEVILDSVAWDGLSSVAAEVL